MENAYQLVFTSPNGGQIEIHTDHLTLELVENQFFALVLALTGKSVKLLPYSYEPKVKNPDAEVDGKVVDFKFPSKTKNPHTAIQTHIKEANMQGASIVVIYLGESQY
jgi:Contact-dependent growth inhibition CdiA C-terminal domain